ncbi:MAG TPA: metalloregulator ArsR/SmtB family transcription factor [Patescibacteria group bacterium]|nr:metalloregulator ArsR/SmtB family transcription factor [Patescibacteria group bacterium]
MYQELFSVHARLYKAMAHPKRLEIIHLLRDQELNVTEMQTMLGLAQSNLSQHLQVLREAGVVAARRNGVTIYYKLTHPSFVRASDLLREVLIAQQKEQPDFSKELYMDMKDLVPLAIDPVCGMRVSPKTAGTSLMYNGRRWYFCATGCKEKFQKHPNTYLVKGVKHA